MLSDFLEDLRRMFDYLRIIDPPDFRPDPAQDKPRQAGGRPLIVLVDPTEGREELARFLAQKGGWHVLPVDSSRAEEISGAGQVVAIGPEGQLPAEYCPDVPAPVAVVMEAYHPARLPSIPIEQAVRAARPPREIVEWLAGRTAALSPRRIPYLLYTAQEQVLAQARQEWADYFQLSAERKAASASDIGLVQLLRLLIKQ